MHIVHSPTDKYSIKIMKKNQGAIDKMLGVAESTSYKSNRTNINNAASGKLKIHTAKKPTLPEGYGGFICIN